MTFTLKSPVLEGTLVRLEPLGHRHAADLARAAEEDRGTYAFTWVPGADEVGAYIDAQLARAATGRLAPYAQVSLATGRALGTTAYWEPRCWLTEDALDAVEVGFTWLARSAQGTGVNAEAKLLLFRHAFEVWDVSRGDVVDEDAHQVGRGRRQRARGAVEHVVQLVDGLEHPLPGGGGHRVVAVQYARHRRGGDLGAGRHVRQCHRHVLVLRLARVRTPSRVTLRPPPAVVRPLEQLARIAVLSRPPFTG
ncbi:hypothetical protein STENM327S_02240 [Streptomyces tendae]